MTPDGGNYYDRVCNFHWALTALLALGLSVGAAASLMPDREGNSFGPINLIGLGTMALLALVTFGMFWRLRVVVTPDHVLVIWGWLEWLRMRFPVRNIESYRVVTFSPIRDFGGWGWRIGRNGSRCYNINSREGVELRIAGRAYVIGVSDPEMLSHALELATRTKPGEPSPWRP